MEEKLLQQIFKMLRDIATSQAELSEQMRCLAMRMEQLQPSQSIWLSTDQAYQQLGYESSEALRRAIRAGHFQSGTEAVKLHGDSGPWRLNVDAIIQRLTKEQTLRRVC